MAAPIITQGVSLEAQSVEVMNALFAAITATPAASRETYSATKGANPSTNTITFSFTLAAAPLADDQVVGLSPKVLLV